MRPGRFEHKDEGRAVAEFKKHERAQDAVRKLIDGGVTPNSISIVGNGISTVEHVTGKASFASAARSGAINGALFGLFFSAFIFMTTPNVAIQLPLGLLLIAVALGILLNLALFAMTRKRRSYSSVNQIIASSYTVAVAGTTQYQKAVQLLGLQTVSSSADTNAPASEAINQPVVDDTPPRYGERISPKKDQDNATGEEPE